MYGTKKFEQITLFKMFSKELCYKVFPMIKVINQIIKWILIEYM